jgi:inosose dehydratase
MKIQQRKSNVTIATAPCSWAVWYADGGPAGTPWDVFLDEASQAAMFRWNLDRTDIYQPMRPSYQKNCPDGTLPYAREPHAIDSTAMPGFPFHAASKNALQTPEPVQCSVSGDDDESDVGEYGEKKQTFTTSQWDKYFGMFKEMGHFTKEVFGIETVFHPHSVH